MTDFGLLLKTEDWETMLSQAQQAEKLKMHSLWIDDHLLRFNHKKPENRIEAWTGLTSIANQTKTIRLGSLVLCNSFRNPALLGKMIASLDVISNGRLELGIGAGWYEEEYNAYGYKFETPSIRIAQLQESLEIFEQLFTGQTFDYHGKYWSLNKCLNLPKPIQQPIPTWIGGTGSKMIKLAVKYGTGLNITSLPPEEFAMVIDKVNKACDDYGRKESSIRKSYMTFVHFTKDLEEREKVIDFLHETWYPQPPRKAFDTLLIGPVELVKEKVSSYIDNYDLNVFIGKVDGTESILDPISLFRDELQQAFE